MQIARTRFMPVAHGDDLALDGAALLQLLSNQPVSLSAVALQPAERIPLILVAQSCMFAREAVPQARNTGAEFRGPLPRFRLKSLLLPERHAPSFGDMPLQHIDAPLFQRLHFAHSRVPCDFQQGLKARCDGFRDAALRIFHIWEVFGTAELRGNILGFDACHTGNRDYLALIGDGDMPAPITLREI